MSSNPCKIHLVAAVIFSLPPGQSTSRKSGIFGALFQALGTLLPQILATGLIALLFHPLRLLVQRGVDRLVYGERQEPYSVLSQLGRRLEGTLVLPLTYHGENVARHARATSVIVRIETGSELRLTVTENGGGLPVDYKAGVGLHSMRERAEELGGAFRIVSGEGVGVTVQVRLPLRGDKRYTLGPPFDEPR